MEVLFGRGLHTGQLLRIAGMGGQALGGSLSSVAEVTGQSLFRLSRELRSAWWVGRGLASYEFAPFLEPEG